MKVAMITGSYPPDVCGAGDYTKQLVGALEQRGISIEVVTGADWKLRDLRALRSRIKACRADVTHVQYPTVGYGREFGPQGIALVERGVVTLHEASQTHILRRISLYPFLLARHIIFTNCFEQAYVSRMAPWVRKSSSIVPIGSNLPIGRSKGERIRSEIVYFGLLRPAKGLESVLELARILKERGSELKVRIVGLPLKEHEQYIGIMRQEAESLHIVWDVGLSDVAAADRLARATFAYAPFPDGASERRGSLLALLGNGLTTVTTRGSHTPAALDGAVEFASSADEAARIFEILKNDAGKRRTLSEQGVRYASQFSWPDIAGRHIDIYSKLLKRDCSVSK